MKKIRKFVALGAVVIGFMLPSSRAASHLDLFATGNDGAVWSASWEPSRSWWPWFLVHNEVKMQPGATVAALWRSNGTHLDLFATGNDGAVWSASWEASRGWSPWFLVHNEVKMQPGATVTALWRSNETHLDLFATGNDGAVWSASWEASRGWWPWFLVHNEVKMQPGATVTALWRSNDTHLDLFATGNDGAVWSASWEASRGWSPWFLVHNEVKMQPGATVTALWRSNETHLDLFATGNDGAVWSASWEASRGWWPWFLVHNEVKMQPGATVTALWRSNDTHLDLFATGNDGAVWTTYWEASGGWRPWFLVHNEVKMQPGATVTTLWGSNDTHLDLFASGNDGVVWSSSWEASRGWCPWFLVHNEVKMQPGATVTALRPTSPLQMRVVSVNPVGSGDHAFSETISLTTWSDAGGTDYKSWTIDEPDITQAQKKYSEISYDPGDIITVSASGCVQTGGLGLTWKDYVNPIGDQPFPGAYAGQIMLPWTGLSGSLHPIAEAVSGAWQVPVNLPPTASKSDLCVTLGYADDSYGDDGYYAHDDGNANQCRGKGPASVTVTIMTPSKCPACGEAGSQGGGPSQPPVQYSLGSKPFDLIWDVNEIDGNGLPFNPRWFAQINDVSYEDVSVRPSFNWDCKPAFQISTYPCYFVGPIPTQSCHDVTENIGVLAESCTTQAPTLDVVGANLFNVGSYCHDDGAALTGHLNWGIVTFDGYTYYNNWSGGSPQDEDFNIALHHSDASGLAAAEPGEEPPNTPSLLLEVKSLELDPYLGSPFWTKFSKLAEGCGGGNPCDEAAGLIWGPAIATGELGIDGAHTGYTELHPLYSLAVHLLDPPDRYDPNSNTVEETWNFFIRNEGTEGSCSQNVHTWTSVSGGTDYYIQLPWPEYATGVSAQVTAWPWQSGDKLGKILITPPEVVPKRTYLQFFLPMGMGSGFDGYVTLTYTLSADAKPQLRMLPKRASGSGSIDKNDEPDWNEVLSRITDPIVKARMQRVLATPPSKPVAQHYPPITAKPEVEIYKPKPSLGSKGLLTRSVTTIDPRMARFRVEMDAALGYPPVTFQAVGGTQDVFVLGTDSKLWLEGAPFGNVPPKRQQVDGNVRTFQALDIRTALVLGMDGNLWLEHAPFSKVPPTREQVDGNVLSFEALDSNNILVLGSDRKLWLEKAPFDKVQPSRQQVDANVRSFQGLDVEKVLVVGTDHKLWLEQAPFGTVPPQRRPVDDNVWSFSARRDTLVAFVLGADGKLWLEQPPYGTVPPARQEVDENVHDFRARALLPTGNEMSTVGDNWVWILGEDRNLWLEQGPFGNAPSSRKQIDGNVWAFQPIDVDHVLVLGTDGNLWLEQSPFGKVPPNRQQIDGNVR